MLLKDLEIRVLEHGVSCMVFIIIKRDDKFYSVVHNHFFEHNNPQHEQVNFAINDFLSICRRIDRTWKAERAISAERRRDTSAMIMEHEIEL